MVPDTLVDEIDYPYTDGQPMGESHLQFTWIYYLFGNIHSIYRHRDDVFVAGNNFLYPVQGRPEINIAPDVYVAYGRPKQKYLKSYKLWEQGNVFPQIVIELLSLSNSSTDMLDKRAFCEQYGCEEYIEINPYTETLAVWTRKRRRLQPVDIQEGWTSPLMGIRFVPTSTELLIYHPDGALFRDYDELMAHEAEMEQNARKLQSEANREAKRADAETKRADAEAKRAEAEQLEKERLREFLKQNGFDPDTI